MADHSHTIPRATLPENGVVSFTVAGAHGVVVDIDGDIRAYGVTGPASAKIDQAQVAEGRLRCPLHGWPIDPDDGRCGAADLCRYQLLPVEVVGDEIRVRLPGD